MYTSYEDFKRELLEELHAQRQSFVSGFDIVTSTKDNIRELEAIRVNYTDERNMNPIIYAEQYYRAYQNGWSMDDVVESVLEIAHDAYHREKELDFSQITPEMARENLELRLINAEWNKELLKECAHIKFNDLVAVPRLNVSVGDDSASILITKGVQQQLLQMTDDEVLAIARENSMKQDFYITNMAEVVREIMMDDMGNVYAEDMIPDDNPMYVLSNTQKSYGAIGLISNEVLGEAKEKIGENFFVIPSSVHETILLGESACENPADLQEMCKEVNATQVTETERLGENIYYYNGHKLQVCNSIEELLVQRHETNHMEQSQTRQRRVG